MLNTAPCRFTIDQIEEHIKLGPRVNIDGLYVASRPYGFYSLPSRLSLAWAVFTGKADALFWPKQMPKAY